MNSVEQRSFFLDDDPEVRGELYTCLTLMLPEMVIPDKTLYYFFLFMKSLKERTADVEEPEWLTWDRDTLQTEFSNYIVNNSESLKAQYDEFQPFQSETIGIKFSGNFHDMDEARKRCERLKKSNNRLTNITCDVGRPLPVCMDNAYLDQIKKKHYGNERLDEVMAGQSRNQENLEEHMEIEKQEQRQQAREEEKRLRSLRQNNENSDNADSSVELSTEHMASVEANNTLMSEMDPWMQRRAELEQEKENKTSN